MFKKAKPIWLKNLSHEMNIQAGFICTFESAVNATLLITGATFFRVYINGNFIHYGPARAAHDYARVDVISLSQHLKEGTNILAIEVAGYNCNSYYTAMQQSYLQAEIMSGDEILASTGYDFQGINLTTRIQKVMRYSFQRHFSEIWCFDNQSSLSDWTIKNGMNIYDTQILDLTFKYLPRGVELPLFGQSNALTLQTGGKLKKISIDKYRRDRYITDIPKTTLGFKEEMIENKPYFDFQELIQIKDDCVQGEFPFKIGKMQYAIIDMGRNITGFIQSELISNADSRVLIAFDEYLPDGNIDFERWQMINIVEYQLKKSNQSYVNQTFEPYGFRYAMVLVLDGEVELKDFSVCEYCYTVNNPPQINTDDKVIKDIYEAAIETFRQNTVDVFMDCPTRERAAWLCDSYFTAQSEYLFTGRCDVEKAFMENYVFYKKDINLPEGMLPMAYPSDNLDGNYIPQWALWYIIELYDYLKRDKNADKYLYKEKIDRLLEYFKSYENEDGLLERLQGWNFVEWSKANKWVQDVNYPTNMLYSRALEIVGELYDDITLINNAQNKRKIILKMSYNGEFFIDNAIRDADGELKNTDHCSEVCQYYAYFFKLIDEHDKKFLGLKNTILTTFGPSRRKTGQLLQIEPANALMGIYLRIELLLKWGYNSLLIKEIKEYFGKMAEYTGTLWEHDNLSASLNHGFASFVGVAIYRALTDIKSDGV